MTKKERRFRTLILTPADEDLVEARLEETGLDFQEFIRHLLRGVTIYYCEGMTKKLLGAQIVTLDATNRLLENEDRELKRRLHDLQEAYKTLELKYNNLKTISDLRNQLSETPAVEGRPKEGNEEKKEADNHVMVEREANPV
jgi:hypothetical protein